MVPRVACAQVVFTSPLPRGILQVQGGHADLRLHLTISGYQNFSIKLSSDIDTTSPLVGWVPVAISNGVVDTLITVPKSLRDYALYWRTGVSPGDTGGTIPGLTPGHVIGIAGQSNAEGFTYDMVVTPDGDIRMLKTDTTWQPAHEPTGRFGGGPWIVMANQLYRSLGDSLPIGIVNAAESSSALTIKNSIGGQWIRNPIVPQDSSVYGNAVRRFFHAGGELEALCWIQGESDGMYLADPDTYRIAFASLMSGFHTDLSDSFPIFHLQIGGMDGAAIAGWPAVREAERRLSPSTMVGTALGRSVEDGLHYSSPTMWAVGRMFAAAILSRQYGIDSGLYPPLLPDTIAMLDSIGDENIKGSYCFSIGWTRSGKSVPVSLLRSVQYFTVSEDGTAFDTSDVWVKISPRDPSRILIGLKNDSISLGHDWKITYDATSEADRAPLAEIDPITGDTIFGTAFSELPVDPASRSMASVKEFMVQRVVLNPSMNELHCYVFATKSENLTFDLLDDLGVLCTQQSAMLGPGLHDIPIPLGDFCSGHYWIELRDENGGCSVEKAVVTR